MALVLVAIMAIFVWRSTSRGHPARTGAVLASIAIVGEALIGAMIVLSEWVADDASVARVISVPMHLVNTLFLLAALAVTIFWLSGGRRLDIRGNPTITRAVVIGGVALVLITATGAITALADTLFPKGAADLVTEEHFLTRLRIVHPILAVAASGIGWWVASRSEAGTGVAARALPILVGLMLLTGLANVALGVPVWMQLIHLALADALWVAYVFASARALQLSAATASRLSPSK